MQPEPQPSLRFVQALSGVGFTDEQILALRAAVEVEIEETFKALAKGVRDALNSEG